MPQSPRRIPRNLLASRWLAASLFAVVVTLSLPTQAEQAPGNDSSLKPASSASMSPPGSTATRGSLSDVRWIATAGLALILAICGGLSIVARRYLPKSAMGGMKVIGRVALTPKHAVYMVQVGRRVLVIGTGPQGSPSLISELDEFEPSLVLSQSPPAVAGRGGES